MASDQLLINPSEIAGRLPFIADQHRQHPPNHISLHLAITPKPLNGPIDIPLLIQPDLDLAVGIDPQHLLIDLKVPHLLKQQSKPPDGRMVQMQHIREWHSAHLRQSQGDPFGEHTHDCVVCAHGLAVIREEVFGAHEVLVIVPEFKQVGEFAQVAAALREISVLLDELAGG